MVSESTKELIHYVIFNCNDENLLNLVYHCAKDEYADGLNEGVALMQKAIKGS